MTTKTQTEMLAEIKGELDTDLLPKFKFVTDLPMRSLRFGETEPAPEDTEWAAQGLRIFEVKQNDARASDGKKRVRLTASSNAFDLVNDVMSKNALERMKGAAVGTTIFLNHEAYVPESVFGAVEATEFVTRTFKVQSAEGKMVSVKVMCLDFDVVVTEKNPRAILTWEQIDEGIVKLGASVTIAIVDKSSASGGGRQIDDVIYLETSIVGIPCNQTAWVQHVKSKSWVHQAKSVLRERDKLTLPPIVPSESKTVTVEEIVEEGETLKNLGKTPAPEAEETAPPPPPDGDQNEAKSLSSDPSDKRVRSFAKRFTKKERQQHMSEKLRKRIAEASTPKEAKDIFSEALQEHFENPWLYVYLMEDCLVELMYFNSNMSAEDKVTAAKDMFASFQSKMMEVLSAYFSDDEDEKSVAMRKAVDFAMVNYIQTAMKEGRRNNKEDQAAVQEMHRLCCSLGAECGDSSKSATAPPVTDPDETDEEKSAGANIANIDEAVKAKKKALREALAQQKTLVDEKAAEIERLTAEKKQLEEDVAFWKAGAESATAQAEELLKQPAPRPGASVS